MNRLIIVGNGFDLAHGLPTKYCDFIDWYWEGVFTDFKINVRGGDFEDAILKISFSFRKRDFYSEQPLLKKEFKEIKSYTTLLNFVLEHNDNNDSCEIQFFNSFFEIINKKRSIENWVDIENEYYKLLKDCLKEENDNSRVKKLNEEFEQVKKLLEGYLSEEVCDSIDFSTPSRNISHIKDIFNVFNRFTDDISFFEEFSKDDRKEIQQYYNKLKEYNNSGKTNLSEFIKSEKIEIENLFLNFNYTPTIDAYIQSLKNTDITYYGTSTNLQIHGRLNDQDNKINFGFGDEMDDAYKSIENKYDREYLTNIKSFQYFQNSNYRRMLDFIDSGNFQVYIMGHSCGLSDRILLNKIFEHDKCRSIKVFFHQFSEPKGDGRTDDYTEIVQNISRHFNKKEMMREKIVNKSLCQPLPQTIRFAKK